MTFLFEHFERYVAVSDALKDEISSRVHEKHFSKGALVHDAKKTCAENYFIVKGLMRLYFIKDGKK